jgi:plasmid stability protein
VTTFEELIAQAKRPGTSVSLCLRGDLTAPYRELERKLRPRAAPHRRSGERSEAAVIAEQMRALETQMAEATTTFTLEAMPRRPGPTSTRPSRGQGRDRRAGVPERWFGWVCSWSSPGR